RMGTLIAGRDVVAVDAVTAAVMGFDPMEVNEVRIADAQGLGVGRLDSISVRGIQIDQVKRSFKRPSPELQGVFPNVDAYLGGACKVCLGFTRAALDALQTSGELQKVESLTLICGKDVEIPGDLKGPVVVIGDCTVQHADRGIFVEGCPAYQVYWKIPEAIGARVPATLEGYEPR
ncbi:MAG: hypothetical protein QW057_06235, partial [Candidatus Bathyarchaeia archaeon]